MDIISYITHMCTTCACLSGCVNQYINHPDITQISPGCTLAILFMLLVLSCFLSELFSYLFIERDETSGSCLFFLFIFFLFFLFFFAVLHAEILMFLFLITRGNQYQRILLIWEEWIRKCRKARADQGRSEETHILESILPSIFKISWFPSFFLLSLSLVYFSYSFS